uniref:Beta-defensin 1 n=1 Tax=Bos indicus x Bos taurus TaxID=30522 RepID=A0A4W2DWU0_BOBOX
MDTCTYMGVFLCVCLKLSQHCAGQLTALGQQSDSYICARKGGTCNLSPCPLYNRVEGTCYRGKAKCCIR